MHRNFGLCHEFLDLVKDWRDNERMHNDDTTCVVIQGDGLPEFEIMIQDSLEELISREALEPNQSEASASTSKTEAPSVGEEETSEAPEACDDITQMKALCFDNIVDYFYRYKNRKLKCKKFSEIIFSR